MNYYYTDAENRPVGPVPAAELQELKSAGAISDERTWVLKEDETEWSPLHSVLGKPASPPKVLGKDDVNCHHAKRREGRWAPASPLRRKLMWGGGWLVIVAGTMMFAGRPGGGFLVLWAGCALLLNRGSVLVVTLGSFMTAAILFFPVPAILKARDTAEEERRKNVSLGLRQAGSVVTDEKLCDTPKAIADAWELVNQVRREDPEWSAAVAVTPRLESCRRSVEQALSRGLQKIMIGQREEWATNAEKKMLDEGMDVEFGLGGAAKDQLTVKWALMGNVAVHKITRDGSMRDDAVLAQMQKIGFRRVSFSNGWNFHVYYTLNPSDETNIGKGVWEGMGVKGPLVLR